MTSDSPYGYENMHDANPHRFGDLSSTIAIDCNTRLGYENPEAASDAANYGYGYGDSEPSMSRRLSSRRERPCRRSSVTKYSLEAQQEVAKAYYSVDDNEEEDQDARPGTSPSVSDDCQSASSEKSCDSSTEFISQDAAVTSVTAPPTRKKKFRFSRKQQ